MGIHSGLRGFKLVLTTFLMVFTMLSASICVSQITENLEIIFQKTYADGAPPDSLWDWGRSIDGAGDVNNDGFDDIIVAANKPFDDPLRPWLGKAYIFLGGNPVDTIPDLILTGSPYGSGFIRVAGVGDFNSDGYDDVVLAQDAGDRAVRLYFGGDPMDTIPDVILETRPGESVATDVAEAGDVNGDSIDDCIIGDYLWAGTDGRALIFLGGSTPDSTADVVFSGRNSEGMGVSVGGGGDLNGDGFDDVVVGADANSEAAPWAGKVYCFFGGSPMDTIADVWLRGEGPSHHLGLFGVDMVPHDDAFSWVVAGTMFHPNGYPFVSRGKIYVAYGDSVADTLVDVCFAGSSDSSMLGISTSWAGDVDSSGFGDIVSGAIYEDKGRGAVYLWLGGTALDTIPDAWVKGVYDDQQVGWVVTCAGDVNADCHDEIVFCNYGAAVGEHSAWIGAYESVGVAELQSNRKGLSWAIPRASPNPFCDFTTIEMELGTTRRVDLEIVDTKGAVVRVIPLKEPGTTPRRLYGVRWDGTDGEGKSLGSGVYFAKLRSRFDGYASSCKLVFVRQ
jgi:hypothetical protein